MRVRVILGIGLAVAVATALVACGRGSKLFGQGHTYPHGPKDMDIVIWLDASCKPTNSEPNVGFPGQKVTWHIVGLCAQLNQSLTLLFANPSPLQSCDSDCSVKIPFPYTAANITAHIAKDAGWGWYNYTLTFGSVTIDPDLEIDP